jgi:hypothetical protein
MGKTSESIIKAEKYSGVGPRIPSLNLILKDARISFSPLQILGGKRDPS